MTIISYKKERVFTCSLGDVKVCDTVREVCDSFGNTMLRNVVRTEYQADWLTEVMARELWEWQQHGFSGPPPDWAA